LLIRSDEGRMVTQRWGLIGMAFRLGEIGFVPDCAIFLAGQR